MSSVLAILANVLSFVLDRVLHRKNDPDFKKSEKAKQEHELRNEHENIVDDAKDDLEKLRRRASD